MNKVLAEKLHSYIVENNPDLLVVLQSERNVTAYIENKLFSIASVISAMQEAGQLSYVIEEKCLEVLTEDLRPSKYNYFYELLEDQFASEFSEWRESGTLTYEIINLIAITESVFEAFDFSETTDGDPNLYNVVIGLVSEYLTKAVEKETVEYGL